MEKREKQTGEEQKALAKRIFRLSLPTMITYGLDSVYGIIDMAWVGRISESAVSGVTLFSTIYMLFTVLNEIAGSGSVAMISQSYGRGNKDRTRVIAEQTISFKFVLGWISFALLCFLTEPALHFYTSKEADIEAALAYARPLVFFIPFQFICYSFNTIFHCTQDAKTPMVIDLIAIFINVIIEPFLIFDTDPLFGLPGLGLGIMGASLSTIIANSVHFLISLSLLLSGRKNVQISIRGLFRLDKEIDEGLLKVGFPSGIQFFFRQFFSAVMVKFVSSYGTAAVAMAGIGTRLENLIYMPQVGLISAGQAITGSALGQEKIEQAETSSQITAKINTLAAAVMGGVMAVFARSLLGFFSHSSQLIEDGQVMIYIMVINLSIYAYADGLKVAFSGSGYNRPTLFITLLTNWGIHLPAMYLIVHVFHLPLNVFWASRLLAAATDLLLSIHFYKKPEWKINRVY